MWNENQRRFHLQPRGSPLLGLCPGLTPTDCPSRGRSQMVQGTVGGRGMGCDAPACAEPAWDLPQVSLSVRSSHPHQWPSTWNQATPWGPEIPAGLMGGQAASSDLHTEVLTPIPRMPSFGNGVSAAGIS